MKKLLLSFIIIQLSIISIGQSKPNIIWLVCEDQSPFFSFYGDNNAYTPFLNQLAKDGIVYDNCFTTSPVCAPSRSSIITGMYATTLGTHNMRSYKKSENEKINTNNQLPFYSAVPKKDCQFFTEILRSNGYYCTNNSKEDYNMLMSPLAWDESNITAHWRNRKENKPFFAVFNFSTTHESKLWKNEIKLTKNEINSIQLPSVFPDNYIIKKDFLTNYKNIELLDKKIGEIIQQLKEDGLYDNTIIFFYSDHGGPFPRYKRSIYDTGIKCPLIIKWIEKTEIHRNNQMISFIDFAPTILDAVGLKNPNEIEGLSFYKKDKRKYIFAATDRFDESITKRRCVRDKDFKLIINYDTITPIYKPIKYRSQMATMEILDSLNNINKSNELFKRWYTPPTSTYELYNVNKDPYEEKNLYLDSNYMRTFKLLKNKLDNWINSSDYGNLTEKDILKQMWPNKTPPKLNPPEIKNINKGIIITTNNGLVSVGWRNQNESTWKIYKKDDVIYPNDSFEVIIFKIGYEPLRKDFEI